MHAALWTITKHVVLCCALTAPRAGRRARSVVADTQARRLRALGGTHELEPRRALERWYGLAEGEPLPKHSRHTAWAQPHIRSASLELGSN